jgi:hypothetical protein
VLDNRRCKVKTASELDKEIRDILHLDATQRGDEVSGTLHVDYSDESVKAATLIPALEHRGVLIVWRKTPASNAI